MVGVCQFEQFQRCYHIKYAFENGSNPIAIITDRIPFKTKDHLHKEWTTILFSQLFPQATIKILTTPIAIPANDILLLWLALVDRKEAIVPLITNINMKVGLSGKVVILLS